MTDRKSNATSEQSSRRKRSTGLLATRQRRKSLAIAVAVALLAVLFYVVTIIRLQQGLK